MSIDPLAQVVALLQPRAVYAKLISAAGPWAVRYSRFGLPSFCIVLEGGCRLALQGQPALTLQAGDFVLLPATPGFTMGSHEPATPVDINAQAAAELMAADMAAHRGGGELRHGTAGGRPELRMLGGYFDFESPDAVLLVSLLPALVHVRGSERLALLVRLVREESLARQPGRELVLTRLVELLLIEALRATPGSHGEEARPGLLRGLADKRLAVAFRAMHADPARGWTVEQLARRSALSRSAFYERFTRAVGLPPMEYLMAWRMAMAKNLLRREELAIGEVAERVGYGSASTFSTAFSRHVGMAPGRFARGH